MEVSPSTYGALFLGAVFASGFSGIVTVQCIIFFKLYPKDTRKLQSLVVTVWILDLTHTCCIIAGMWDYFISHFGDDQWVDVIPKSIALSVIFTAVLTFLAHCFFANRIFLLSKRNWYFPVPILLLALGRLITAAVSGAEMISLKDYILFRQHFEGLFSVGLAISSTVDIMVTLLLFFLLQRSRRQSMSLHETIDSLIVYFFEIGSVTSAATVISMICWLTFKDNLIFLGFHFVIGKLYANSVLTTLNTRHEIGRGRAKARDLMGLEPIKSPQGLQFFNTRASDSQHVQTVEVSVEKTVQFDDA